MDSIGLQKLLVHFSAALWRADGKVEVEVWLN
jgi:hypothetical protein